jgi:hypothetical protein
MTGPSGNNIRECGLEATDEFIIRLLGVVADIQRKYVSGYYFFFFFSEGERLKCRLFMRKKERARTDCGTLRGLYEWFAPRDALDLGEVSGKRE